jgi:hypothetical protein
MGRAKRMHKKLAAVLAVGICFQNVQCAVETEELGAQFLTTIVTFWVTDYVNNLFGVNPSAF